MFLKLRAKCPIFITLMHLHKNKLFQMMVLLWNLRMQIISTTGNFLNL